RGEKRLELGELGTEGEPPRAQHLDHGPLLLRAQDRLGQRDLLGAHCASPGAGTALALSPRSPSGRRPGCMPYSSESTSASHDAAIRFSETPIDPHTSCPSEASMSTRVTAPVPWLSSRM